MRKKVSKEQARDYKERFYKKQREQGLCLECMNPVVEAGSRCAMHLERRREKRKEKQREAIVKGLCIACLLKPSLQGNRLCANDYYKQASNRYFGTTTCWRQLKDKFEAQGGKCALSGYPLTLGFDTELDHIKPLSRQGCKDISNVQWVVRVVNRMKDNMLEEDFYDLIKSLFKHMTQQRRRKI